METAIITANCTRCNLPFSTHYQRIGFGMRCPACFEVTAVESPIGVSLPDTGWELTYQEFRQLIEESSSRRAVSKLLTEWFGYRIENSGRETWLKNDRAEAIDPWWLHSLIQNDPQKRYRIYQTAMALWR